MSKPHFIMTLNSPTGAIPLTSLARATRALSSILCELDKEISRSEVALVWAVTNVRMRSPAEFEIAPVDLKEGLDPELSIATAIEGLGCLEKKSERPPFFNDSVLRPARALADLLDKKNIDGISLGNGRQRVKLSHHLVANVDVIIPSRKEESTGALDGKLQIIDVHGGLTVGIYTITEDRPVRVHFKDVEKMTPKVKEALGQRVYAVGELKRDHAGHPKSILIEDFEILPDDSELPKLEDIYGIDPDFTDGLSVIEYLRKLRDED